MISMTNNFQSPCIILLPALFWWPIWNLGQSSTFCFSWALCHLGFTCEFLRDLPKTSFSGLETLFQLPPPPTLELGGQEMLVHWCRAGVKVRLLWNQHHTSAEGGSHGGCMVFFPTWCLSKVGYRSSGRFLSATHPFPVFWLRKTSILGDFFSLSTHQWLHVNGLSSVQGNK